MKERVIAADAQMFLDSLWQDLCYCLRTLRKSPGFTAVAVLTLALGIGANATVFILANAVLFKNLPFANSDRVLYISSENRENGFGRGESYPDYSYLESRVRSFQSLAAFSSLDVDISDRSTVPTQVRGLRATYNTFSAIGVEPFLGRDFLPEDVRPGAAPVAILAHTLWQNRYGMDRNIIGKTILVNNVPTVVIGVMPPGFRFPRATSVWLPLIPLGQWQNREYRGLTVFGRLARTASLSSARAEMNLLAADLASAFPASDSRVGIQVETYNDYFTDSDTRLTYFALLGAVAFVLLIACANVANLLLARAANRVREISIRAALGAGKLRIIRQLLVEGVILAGLAGILGSFLGIWGVRLFKAKLIPDDAAAYGSLSMDYRVLIFLIALVFLTGFLFGVAPAFRLSRLDPGVALKEGGHSSSGGKQMHFLSAVLVVGETALAFVLLVGAGLMIRSFLNMTRTPIGVRTDHILSMDLILRGNKYPTPQSQILFHRQLNERLQALPGIQSIAMASNLPGDGWTDFAYELEGIPSNPHKPLRVGGVVVSASYFSIFNIRQLRGRVFNSLDRASAVPVVVVNESFARMSWRDSDPVGKRLHLLMPPLNSPNAPASVAQAWLTVVGVVPDIVQSDSSEGAHDPLIYLPYPQLPQREMVIAARTVVPPGTLAGAFRSAVQELDPELPVTDLRTLDRLLWERAWPWRVYGSMFSIFAAIALLLASVGLYAVSANAVSQRTREFGIRMALGASDRNILRTVLMQGLRRLSLGLVAGFVGSFGLNQFLQELLIGIRPLDPATYISVASILALSTVLGCAIPARRAMKVDPMVALRHE
jgi:predicted permease